MSEQFELKPCPCKTCQLRLYYAHLFDVHIWGEDRPYQCELYAKWKETSND